MVMHPFQTAVNTITEHCNMLGEELPILLQQLPDTHAVQHCALSDGGR